MARLDISEKMSKVEETIKQVDELYNEKEWKKMYDFLKEALQDPTNEVGEVYWRMARCCREMANRCEASEKKAYTFEAFENSTKGVEKDPENADCNKWQGIMLDLSARFEGIKKRIENSYKVKEHLEKAISVRPNDATTLHSLGVWCFEFADLPWYQKKIASAFFATPPSSSYPEALKYFEKAEEVNANFYSYNLVYLGKTYLRLGRKDDAKKTFQQCLDLESTGAEDDEAKKEATTLMKKC